jgi:hypothetical protein
VVVRICSGVGLVFDQSLSFWRRLRGDACAIVAVGGERRVISRLKDESENHCLLKGRRRREKCVVDDKMMRRH